MNGRLVQYTCSFTAKVKVSGSFVVESPEFSLLNWTLVNFEGCSESVALMFRKNSFHICTVFTLLLLTGKGGSFARLQVEMYPKGWSIVWFHVN